MNLHCHKAGNPKGRPIIFLHGLFGSSKDFDAFKYFERDRLCFYFDLPGHGRSIAFEFSSFDEFGHYFFKQLGKFDQKPDLVGYSLGGRLGLFLLSHYPDFFNKAVIVSANPGITSEIERSKRLEQDLLLLKNIENKDVFFKNWYEASLFGNLKNHANFKNLLEERQNCDLDKIKKCVRFLSVGTQSPLWESLSFLKNPVLFITGSLDEKYNLFSQRLVKNSSFKSITYPGLGHNPLFETPEQILKTLIDFLR